MTDLAPTPTSAAAFVDDTYVAPRGILATSMRFLRRQPVGTIGMVIVVVFGFCGLFADWLAPYSPTSNDFAARFYVRASPRTTRMSRPLMSVSSSRVCAWATTTRASSRAASAAAVGTARSAPSDPSNASTMV